MNIHKYKVGGGRGEERVRGGGHFVAGHEEDEVEDIRFFGAGGRR